MRHVFSRESGEIFARQQQFNSGNTGSQPVEASLSAGM